MPMVRRIELDWPCSITVMHRFADYLTDVLAYDPAPRPRPAGSRAGAPMPVLFLCLLKGLEAYDDAASEPDNRRLLAFIDGTFAEAARLLGGISLFKPNNDCWMAGMGIPLRSWMAADTPAGITVHRSQRRGASQARIIAAMTDYALAPRDRRIVDLARQHLGQ